MAMADLSGRVALVTGGGSGIGLTLAGGLVSRGCRVVIGDVAFGQDAEAFLADHPEEVTNAVMDVTDDEKVALAVDKAVQTFGRLDVLINNAGLYTTIRRVPLAELTIAEWEKVFAVNVTGVFRTVKACLPALRDSGAGRVINISSATVFSAPPNLLHYVATKGALTAMTRSMARELGSDGITVNAVAPGFTLSSGVLDAKMESASAPAERARNARALKRDQMPDDVVGAVCFLAGGESAFITGQTLVVDGGTVMH